MAILAVVVLVLLAVAIYGIYWSMGRPLYTPGMVKGGETLAAPLEPPSSATQDPGYLEVAPGIRLRYFTDGGGPLALVLHGGPGFAMHKPWEGLTPLGTRLTFLYYHQRGCGESSRPIDRFPTGTYMENIRALNRTLGLAEQIADIERIRRIQKQDKIVIVGHSFGGLLASLYAAEFPDRVRAMILVAPADLVVMPSSDGGLYEQVRSLLPAPMKASYQDFLRRYFDFGSIFQKDEASLAALNREFIPFYEAAARAKGVPIPAGSSPQNDNGGWMVTASFFGLGRHHDYRDAVEKVKAPVLIVHGGLDLQPEKATRNYLAYFPHAKFVILPRSGHFPFADAPAEFANAVGTFLSGL